MNMWWEMREECELAWLVGSVEHCNRKPEFLGESIRIGGIEFPFAIEHSYTACAFSGLDDNLYSPGIEPPVTSCDCILERLLSKGTLVLFAHLVLNGQSPLMSHLYDCLCLQRQFRQPLSPLHPYY